MAGFDIGAFDPAAFTLLGEGLWGRVYDLDDGTVLKIARESCAGIGSGCAKIENEYAALSLLKGTPSLARMVPQPLDKGVIAEGPLHDAGFDLWLRTTKIAGDRLSLLNFQGLAAPAQQETGMNIGRTLARLHKVLRAAAPATAKEKIIPYAEIEKETAGQALYRDIIAVLRQARARVPADFIRPAHGDFNISNLLFTGTIVCGILDFAEWGYDFPEKDISDITKELPILRDPLIRGYEEESGLTVDAGRLTLGLMENMLYSAIINDRTGDSREADAARAALQTYRQDLGRQDLGRQGLSTLPASGLKIS